MSKSIDSHILPLVTKASISLILSLLLLNACGNTHNDDLYRRGISEERLDKFRIEIGKCFARHDYDKSLKLSRELASMGRKSGNTEVYLAGIVYIGQTYICMGNMDSMRYYLNEAMELAIKTDDNWALATIYNALGIYSLFTELDYPKGISYLMDGVRHAELSDNGRMFLLKSNLSLAYYLRNDPAGLPYALDVYSLGQESDHDNMIFSGARRSAYMYYLLENYEEALKYIEIAIPLSDLYGDKMGVYTLYGDILLALGEESQAVEHYKTALTDQSMDHFSDIDGHLSYGVYLLGKGEYGEAIDIMKQGVDKSHLINNPSKRYLLYHSISSAFESARNPDSALFYYKLYHLEADSIFNADKERAIGELKIRHEKERHENEIRDRDLQLFKSQKQLQLTSLMLAIIFLTAIGLYVLHYRKNKHYQSLLKQHQDAIEKERWYREQLEKHSVVTDLKPKYHTKTNVNDKMEELFSRLQELMMTQKIYRQHNLNRDEVARMLSTNRTYLSQVINKFTGLPFLYYVNSFRIDDAVRMLSDPKDDTPIKAIADELGFTALSSFYKFFHAATGLPPSQFREQVKNSGRHS